MKEQKHIEEILTEAHSYNRRDEVVYESNILRHYFPRLTMLESYQKAFDRLITLDEKNK